MPQGFGDAGGDRFDHAGRGVEKQHGEFIAAVAGGKIGGATLLVQDASEALEGAITGEVAEAVVDALEVVEVEEEQPKRARIAVSAEEFSLKVGEKFAMIGEASQAIVGGLVANVLFGALAVGDVQGDADTADDRAGGIAKGFDADVIDALAAAILETRRVATQRFEMLSDGGGLRIAAAQEFEEGEVAGPRGGEGLTLKAGAPVRGEVKAGIGGPERDGELLDKETEMGLGGGSEGRELRERRTLDDGEEFALGTKDGEAAKGEEETGTVLMEALGAFGSAGRLENGEADELVEGGKLVEREEERERLADDVLGGVAVEAFGGGVPNQDCAVISVTDDSVIESR